jgi:DNA polymerase-4
MDAFYASVEQRDNPEYRGKALVVGGSPEGRGVVCAASYEARKFGIFSAMPSRTAVQKCPNVIFVRPRFDVYHEISHQIRAIFHQYTDLVEPLALDEAYLDVTENKRGLPSATLIAREIKEQILKETQLTASAGISINKFLAKTASGINKPNGMCLITPDKVESFMEKLPIEKFYGVGEVTAKKMHQHGIRNGADLKKLSELELLDKFGKMGSFFYLVVRGQDHRPVTPNRVRKSVGAEESYAEDLSTREAMIQGLEEIARTLIRRIGDHGGGRTLTFKAKYANYQQVTRSRTMLDSINTFETIMKIAVELMDTTEVEARNARLLGLALSNLDSERENDEVIQLTLQFS